MGALTDIRDHVTGRTASVAVPRPADDPGVATARAKLADVQREHSTIERQIQETLSGLSSTPSRNVHLDEQAKALLAGTDIADSVDLIDERLRKNLDRLYAERQVLKRAIQLQLELVQREEARVATAIRTQLRSRYQDVARRIDAALTQLSAVLEEGAAHRALLDSAGVSSSVTPSVMQSPLGPLRSSAQFWRDEARKEGLL